MGQLTKRESWLKTAERMFGTGDQKLKLFSDAMKCKSTRAPSCSGNPGRVSIGELVTSGGAGQSRGTSGLGDGEDLGVGVLEQRHRGLIADGGRGSTSFDHDS